MGSRFFSTSIDYVTREEAKYAADLWPGKTTTDKSGLVVTFYRGPVSMEMSQAAALQEGKK